MSGKKLALAGAGLFVLVFGGVLAGLQADRWLGQRSPVSLGVPAPGGGPLIDIQSPVGPKPAFDFTAAAKKVIPSVVSVDNLREGRSFFGETVVARRGSGSGVIISNDGYILTNNHVVQGASYLRVKLSDERMFPAELIGRDPRSDLALIKIKAGGLTAATFGDSSSLKPGEWIMAVGSPLGYDNTISVGVVSSVGRTLPTEGALLVDTIQTDAAINQGNSGGALTNASGELVGINTAIASMDGGSIGIGFSIPIHRAKRVVDDFLKYRRARYGDLGLGYDPRDGILQDPEARQELKQITNAPSDPPSQGLLVVRVSTGSPGARAGIRRFDVITGLDGRSITDKVAMESIMLNKKPGDTAKVKFWSSGKEREVTVTLEDITN